MPAEAPEPPPAEAEGCGVPAEAPEPPPAEAEGCEVPAEAPEPPPAEAEVETAAGFSSSTLILKWVPDKVMSF